MQVNIYYWIGFLAFVLTMLVLDLGVFNKKAHEIKFKEASLWTVFWVSLALTFNVIVYINAGEKAAIEFLTGYFIEYSLSIDNIFVFIMIFSYFNVPAKYNHKVLFWGIIGALVMRAIFIFSGVALITKFHWIIYIFGAFLVFTGIKMLIEGEKEIHPEKNPVLNLFKKIFPVHPEYVEGKFFIKKDGHRYATALFLVLIFVETSDIIFAVDSIPAILSITQDPFIVFTSNIFAILGLRSLYFAVSGVMKYFRFLSVGLSGILMFVGVKMLIDKIFKIPTIYSFLIILSIVAVSILASIVIPDKNKK
jgi:tellurite resistance protein TerC